jgi:hypothetical protein
VRFIFALNYTALQVLGLAQSQSSSFTERSCSAHHLVIMAKGQEAYIMVQLDFKGK